jgi:hypothetical protein
MGRNIPKIALTSVPIIERAKKGRLININFNYAIGKLKKNHQEKAKRGIYD